MPGQNFELSVTILWNDTQRQAPSIVIANVTQDDAQVEGGPWIINGTEIINVVAHGHTNQTITLSLCIATDKLTCTDKRTTTDILLKSCMVGFEYDETAKQCNCDIRFVSPCGYFCSPEYGKIQVPQALWLGPIQDKNTDIVAHTDCLEDYCKEGSVSFSNNDFDFQCKENRTGVGCGSCSVGTSAVFGSSQCMVCDDYTLLLIFVFFVTGLLTVAGIALLKITLTEGYLNGVLFYSNIVNLFAANFTMPTSGKGAFFLTAWISQNLGIPACFYDGMDSLAAVGFHFLYIGYLFVLTLLLSPILRYKSYAPSKVLSTLLMVCYISLLEISVRVISFTKVVTLDGEVFVRWRFDANVVYFSGAHIFFFILAVLLLICLVLLPLLIISPRITYKIRVFNKLQPFLDTIWAPLKPKYRWWVSFRLLLRWIIFLVALFAKVPNSILSTVIVLSLLLFVQSQFKPFQGHWQNVIDEALVLNVILILIGYLFFYFSPNKSVEQNNGGLRAYRAVFAVLAYLLFAVVFAIHMFSRFPKCKQFLSSVPEKLKTFRTPRPYHVMEDLDRQEADESPVVTFSEINLSRDEREEDRENLTRELSELEALSKANAASQTAGSKSSRPKLSSKESFHKGEQAGLALTVKKADFSEDREPLLADDSV